jgi:hypothetical protein
MPATLSAHAPLDRVPARTGVVTTAAAWLSSLLAAAAPAQERRRDDPHPAGHRLGASNLARSATARARIQALQGRLGSSVAPPQLHR